MRINIRTLTIFLIFTIYFWILGSILKLTTRRVIINTPQYRFIKDYIISPSNTFCQKTPFIIIIVPSYVGHIELRNVFRSAMPREFLDSMNTTRLFLLSKIPRNEKNITQSRIDEENENFQDILQGSFIEDYHNLTIKHLMGLQWVATECGNVSYILKVDDDTVFNLERLSRHLTMNPIQGDFLMGYMLNNTKPKRDVTNKWYVSLEEFPGKEYPPYVSGWYYITTPSVAGKLVNEAMYHSYFWIDDILVTGILIEALNVPLIQMHDDFWFEYSVNCVIHGNRNAWDPLAYNYTLAIVKLAKTSR